MALVRTQVTARWVASSDERVWKLASEAVRKWLTRWRRRRGLGLSPLSSDWLRRHHIDASKHQSDL